MKKSKKGMKFDYLILGIILLFCLGQTVSATVNSSGFHTVIDSRGVSVQIPDEINRVVTIDDGFGLEVMSIFGIPEKLIGVGSRTFEEVDNYDYQSVKGENFTFSDGMNTMRYLHPSVKTLPVIAEYEAGVNYEALAALKTGCGNCQVRRMHLFGLMMRTFKNPFLRLNHWVYRL